MLAKLDGFSLSLFVGEGGVQGNLEALWFPWSPVENGHHSAQDVLGRNEKSFM